MWCQYSRLRGLLEIKYTEIYLIVLNSFSKIKIKCKFNSTLKCPWDEKIFPETLFKIKTNGVYLFKTSFFVHGNNTRSAILFFFAMYKSGAKFKLHRFNIFWKYSWLKRNDIFKKKKKKRQKAFQISSNYFFYFIGY